MYIPNVVCDYKFLQNYFIFIEIHKLVTRFLHKRHSIRRLVVPHTLTSVVCYYVQIGKRKTKDYLNIICGPIISDFTFIFFVKIYCLPKFYLLSTSINRSLE